MKKIKVILISLFCLLVIPKTVFAASGKINVSGTSTVVVGNNVTVTVTLSSSTLIGSWEMSLNYDKNYLQLRSATSESNGIRMAASTATGVKSKSYTFTFKTLKKGSTSVSVGGYLAYAYADLSEISLSSNSKKINIITQAELEASYSKNNNLASLGVEGFTLTPEFNANTLEYSVTVPEDTKNVNITGTVQDKKASITGVGVQQVNQGNNKFLVTVKAENGSEKTYTINVDVKDENPIEVTVGDKKYTVVKIKENLPIASLYNEYSVKINEFDIPAYKNDYTGLVLVGLKDTDGNISLFIYDDENNSYKEYNELKSSQITIYPLKPEENVEGYKKGNVKIQDIDVEGFYLNEDSDFFVIYGVNVETGDKGFYMYDKKMQTLIKYNDELSSLLSEKIKLYTYIIIGFISLSVVMLIIIIVLVCKKGKKKKRGKDKEKVVEEKINKEDKNEIIEM
ncbi:putative uncharacterized protein [Clostridium sp. CAG:609]|nr:putative uncharacterized protein [Clostridium sp. CAG:609]